MNATFDFAVSGIVPFGALVGGIAGELLGLRLTLFLAATGELASVAWLLWSPVRTLWALIEQGSTGVTIQPIIVGGQRTARGGAGQVSPFAQTSAPPHLVPLQRR
jgi:hypothetical protein